MTPNFNGFIQTSDIHIGECRSLKGYLGRHKQILEQILNAAIQSGLPLIISGDLFHRKDTTYEERTLASWWLGSIERAKIPCIVTAGNHDHLKGTITQIDDYKYMPFNFVKVVGWQPETVIIGDTGYVCISWGNYTTEQLAEITRNHLPLIKDCKYKVVLVHECIVGSRVDNGFLMPKGTAIPVIPEITYWAVGDIHTTQQVNVKNGWYAGAPAQFKFDDVLPKGVLKVNLDAPDVQPEFIPVNVKPLKVVSSVEQITEDAYYMVEGDDFKDILAGNQHEQVVKTKWSRPVFDALVYQKMGIIDGLPEFLAEKGIPEAQQQFAVDWVKQSLNIQGDVA